MLLSPSLYILCIYIYVHTCSVSSLSLYIYIDGTLYAEIAQLGGSKRQSTGSTVCAFCILILMYVVQVGRCAVDLANAMRQSNINTLQQAYSKARFPQGRLKTEGEGQIEIERVRSGSKRFMIRIRVTESPS